MEKESVRPISIGLTFGTLVPMAIFAGISYGQDYKLAVLIGVSLGSLIIGYFVISAALSRWRDDHFKSMSDTINSFMADEERLNKSRALNIESMEKSDKLSDVVMQVNDDVAKWAKDRTNEITILKNNEKFRKEFLGNVTHELKTPLFNIQGYIETLIDDGYDDPEIRDKYLDRTAFNIERLIGIVNDLDTISQLESGVMKINPEKFDVMNVVEKVVDLYGRQAQERNISVEIDCDPHLLPVMVSADKNRIYEVVSNLVLNSIKYGNEGGYTKVSIVDIESRYLISVKDNGIGISDENLQRVFERFFREDKARSSKAGGTGLGLSIVKHIIEAHGERITVQSKKGEGSTFSFTLKKSEK